MERDYTKEGLVLKHHTLTLHWGKVVPEVEEGTLSPVITNDVMDAVGRVMREMWRRYRDSQSHYVPYTYVRLHDGSQLRWYPQTFDAESAAQEFRDREVLFLREMLEGLFKVRNAPNTSGSVINLTLTQMELSYKDAYPLNLDGEPHAYVPKTF